MWSCGRLNQSSRKLLASHIPKRRLLLFARRRVNAFATDFQWVNSRSPRRHNKSLRTAAHHNINGGIGSRSSFKCECSCRRRFLRLGKENVGIGSRTSVLIQGANRGGIEGRGKLDGYGGPRCGRVGANVNCKSGGLAGALRRNGVYVCRGAPLVVQGNFAGVKIGAEIGLNAGNLQCRRNPIGGRNIVVGISAHAKIVDAVNAGDRTRKKCIRGAFNVISR